MLKNWFKREGSLVKFLLSVALFIYFIFGFYHLSDFISADEHFWLPNAGFERISEYWKAVKKGDWKDTRINDKPGITLAYTSGIAMLVDKDPHAQIIQNGTAKIFNPEKTKQINFLYRIPILIFNGFFSFFFFWIVKKITSNSWIGLWSAVLILLSPVLLGISQIVNPDSLFWIFASASLFSFFSYLQDPEKKTAIFSGLFLGLGLASKYVSVILFPFFFFMMLVFYLFNFENWREKKEYWRRRIIKNSLVYLAVLASGLLIFAILMPASFFDPKAFYSGTIGFTGMEPIFWTTMLLNAVILFDAWLNRGRLLGFIFKKTHIMKKILPIFVYAVLSVTVAFVLANWMSRNSLVDFSEISFDLKQNEIFGNLPFIKKYIMEFVPLVFSLTPFVLLSLIFLWIKSIFSETKFPLLVFLLSSFILIFFAAVIKQGLLVTTRYSIIIFPLSMVMASISFWEFFNLEKTKKQKLALFVFILFVLGTFIMFLPNIYEQSLSNVGQDQLYAKLSDKFPLIILTATAAVVILSILSYRFFPWNYLKKTKPVWIFVALIFISLASLVSIMPFYFSYTNELLPKKYIIAGAWGYGGYEAAQFLNRLPNAKELTLWADAYGVCEFFVGKCIHKAKVNTDKYPIDYYFRSLQSTLPLNFPHPMEKNPVWSLQIDGRPKSFLKVYKALPVTADNQSEDINSENNDQEPAN